jgi:serine/threonine-protein kinase HipA
MAINKVNVFIKFSTNEELLGQLVIDGREVFFKYSAAFLERKLNVSPLKLKLDDSIQSTSLKPFDGLFGVFADSLPDAWGRLLMRRHLSQELIAIESLNVLDELSYVGQNGLGALIYRPSVDVESKGSTDFDLDELNSNIRDVLKGESSEIIDDLFQQGGSPGGARPKIYAGYNPTTDRLIQSDSDLPEGYEHWIIKFAATVDEPDIANIEMAYYRMALDAGLRMSESKLFKSSNGNFYFGTKRFDRVGNDRFHMISAAGLFHDDYIHSQLDYGHYLHQAFQLTGSVKSQEDVFRHAAFNVFAHNRDDHSKNFAFLMDRDGQWMYAPAYDLTFSSSSQGMHSTTCAGNGVNPGTEELLELASEFSIKSGSKIIEEVKSVVSNWGKYADQTGVSDLSKLKIDKKLQELLRN